MYQTTIIGRLGANAEVGESNGRKFVRFRVATTRAYKKADGTSVENTQWHSCIMSGDGGGLLPYLVKGQAVCVVGNEELGIVSSPKLKRMVATSDVQVNSIELIGGKPDDMPKYLATPDGALHNVYKAYYFVYDEIKDYFPQAGTPFNVYDNQGNAYEVDCNGFVKPVQSQEQATQEENAEGF